MAASLFSLPPINSSVANTLLQASRAASYDDFAVLALLALGGAGYLTRGSLWNKPDPYYHKWFERPQESALNGLNIKKETRNISEKLEETKRDVVIFWGSQSGTAEGFAHRLARDCHRRFRLEALVADLSDYDCETIALIPESKFAIFIVSTYGEGDPSDNTAEFWTWLRDVSDTSLKNLRYLAFGLGNSNYKYYNKVVDVVVEKLNSFGASPLLPVGKANDANGATEEDFLSWKEDVFSLFRTSFGLTERDPEYEPTIKVVEDDSMTSIDLHLGAPVQQRNAKKAAAACSPIGSLPIKESRELFSKTSANRSCIHMELDLSKTPQIKYKTGDHIAIWPINANEEVTRLLNVLGLESKKDMPISILSLDAANTKIKVPTPTCILALFQHYLEICAPVSRETVLSLAQFAPTSEIKTTLLGLGKDKEAYNTFLLSNHVTIGRLLEYTNTKWPNLPLSFIIESLTPMAPRYYSISSSSIVSPRSASLTAVVSSAPLAQNSSRFIPGLATNYLSALMPSSTINAGLTYPLLESGSKVHAHIRKSTFKLPANPNSPIIMVAAGTGLAPFRGFLQERARLKSMEREVGPMLLFFGCRNPEEDFLYQTEIEEMQDTSLKDQLTVLTAFSRVPGQAKVYVQDQVEEHASRVCDLVLDEDATFYICGSANMARDVSKRLGEKSGGAKVRKEEKCGGRLIARKQAANDPPPTSKMLKVGEWAGNLKANILPTARQDVRRQLPSNDPPPSTHLSMLRQRHLKCDNEKPVCKRCERNGDSCTRGGAKIKFRHGSSARYDSEFSRDQTWLKTGTKSRHLEYVDETEDLANYYAQENQQETVSDNKHPESRHARHLRTASFLSEHGSSSRPINHRIMAPPTPLQAPPRSSDVFESPLKRRKTNDAMPPLVRSTSEYQTGSPDSRFSLPLQSPNFSLSSLHSPRQPIARPVSAHDNIQSFDYASLLGSTQLPDNDLTGSKNAFEHTPSLGSNRLSDAGLDILSPTRGSLDLLSPGKWNQNSVWPHASLQEASLMKYFVENLAHWFDLCDPERHFAVVVPQRARSCPPLLNAIFTASARHLSRLSRYKTALGVQWQDKFLPDLTPETAIHYHSECITHLIQLSNEPEQLQDENLLAAAIILRFYEEVDAPLRDDEDGELFLRVINMFIEAQLPLEPALPHTSPMTSFPLPIPAQATSPSSSNTTSPTATAMMSGSKHPSLASQVPIPRPTGLRQASLWVAFRQEIYTAFMKQRAFGLSLERCESFRSFAPAEDAVWADRLIIYCADVLQFCHGNPDPATNNTSHSASAVSTAAALRGTKERWDELKRSEKTWSEVLPSSFEPIFVREPDTGAGEVFPQIWYLTDHHVAGIQHVELARILLSVYNPSLPKLGPGLRAAQAALTRDLKDTVKRLCGIALSNRRTPPGLVTACMGIAMCGERFDDRHEQEALLGVLNELDFEHAWPTAKVGESLRAEWGW